MSSQVPSVTKLADLKNPGLTAVLFYATWHTPSTQFLQVFSSLSTGYKTLSFVSCDIEAGEEIAEKYKVESVPTLVIINPQFKAIHTVTGADPKKLVETLDTASKAPQPSSASAPPKSNEDLSKLVNQSKVMLFMKGVPDAPQCGFSRKMVDLLKQENVEFGSFNILSDNDVREGLKKFSNWPTYPQLYVKGKLIGGLDIVRELVDEGEFSDLLN